MCDGNSFPAGTTPDALPAEVITNIASKSNVSTILNLRCAAACFRFPAALAILALCARDGFISQQGWTAFAAATVLVLKCSIQHTQKTLAELPDPARLRKLEVGAGVDLSAKDSAALAASLVAHCSTLQAVAVLSHLQQADITAILEGLPSLQEAKFCFVEPLAWHEPPAWRLATRPLANLRSLSLSNADEWGDRHVDLGAATTRLSSLHLIGCAPSSPAALARLSALRALTCRSPRTACDQLLEAAATLTQLTLLDAPSAMAITSQQWGLLAGLPALRQLTLGQLDLTAVLGLYAPLEGAGAAAGDGSSSEEEEPSGGSSSSSSSSSEEEEPSGSSSSSSEEEAGESAAAAVAAMPSVTTLCIVDSCADEDEYGGCLLVDGMPARCLERMLPGLRRLEVDCIVNLCEALQALRGHTALQELRVTSDRDWPMARWQRQPWQQGLWQGLPELQRLTLDSGGGTGAGAATLGMCADLAACRRLAQLVLNQAEIGLPAVVALAASSSLQSVRMETRTAVPVAALHLGLARRWRCTYSCQGTAKWVCTLAALSA
jgi:hypothetical protein